MLKRENEKNPFKWNDSNAPKREHIILWTTTQESFQMQTNQSVAYKIQRKHEKKTNKAVRKYK